HVLGGSAQDIAGWRMLQKSANVVWYGRSAPARVPAFLAACDVLLAPYGHGAKTSSGNDTSRWMSPLKIFEYMASGKPMIVSDFPVLREVLTDDIAELVEPSNVDAWRAALARLDDEAARKRLGDAAREAFESRYTWAARARGVLEGLDEAPVRRPRKSSDAGVPATSATGRAGWARGATVVGCGSDSKRLVRELQKRPPRSGRRRWVSGAARTQRWPACIL